MRKAAVFPAPGSFFRVAQLQINPTVGDFAHNQKLIADGYSRAISSGANLVLAPELALSGYPPEDLVYRKSFFDQDRRALKRLSSVVAEAPLIVGCLNRAGKSTDITRLSNSAAILAKGRIVGFYDKVHLPNYGVFDERRYFVPGHRAVVLDWPSGFRVGVSICEDIWIPGGDVLLSMKRARPDLMINLSASPYHRNKINERLRIIRKAARQLGSCLAYTNLVGGQDELVFDGRSLFVDSSGKIMNTAAAFDEDIIYSDIPIAHKKFARPALRSEAGLGRVLEVHRVRISASGMSPKNPNPVRSNSVSVRLSEVEEVYAALTLSLADYTRKNGFEKVVVGMSGGIDSAVVGAIVAAVMGADQCLFVTMPSHITSPETLSDAKRLAANLGVQVSEIPIAPIYDTAILALRSAFCGDGELGLAEENLQARIRGLLLMAISNKRGHLVVTTGNKSEMATGYCTLYGDMAGGFALIKDVPKTTVYELARLINRRSGRELIPSTIIRRPPTAELRVNQRDQDSLPPYPMLDAILNRFVEGLQGYDQMRRTGKYPTEVLKKVIRLVDRSEYKRRQAPPGTKITPLAFGRDRRMPVTHRFKEVD